MKFSALASLYSGERPEYLDQALESLHKQTLQADEVVIVHDGPLTEELYCCLDKWKSSLRIKEVKLQHHKGLGTALNAGLRECSHKTVARFDTDDINHPRRFEIQIKHLEKNPEISVLGTYAVLAFEGYNENNLRPIIYPQSSHKEIYDFSVHSHANIVPILHPTVVFSNKQEVFSVGGYVETTKISCFEFELFFAMMKRGYIVENVPSFLLYYRRYPNFHFYFKKMFRVDVKKRYGLYVAWRLILLWKTRRELGMVFGHKTFLTFLKSLLKAMRPFNTIHYSFSKQNPKEYKGLRCWLVSLWKYGELR